ncbi:hypothetical protein BBI01_18630 [Chryseobacterium artocarpi]|uniref:DNA-binding protein n=1 Tax=Chryseobacterium artocarpi TaxID=1414727 RepID=A0A1B8ZA17_9FLAO|nr:Abi family protein [Chryseobacterium artocarpi]OCA68461.1 hypothetical protein BBI01_18630 [Chryseobacterium artocarpi]
MGRNATTITSQIALLKSRGLIINNEPKAEELLLDIGYYRLGFYWHYFQSDPLNHIFRTNITLEDIVSLYYFDFDLKTLLSRYIYRIEVHFRTQLVYLVSNHYNTDSTWYVDSRNVDSSIMREFNNIYYNLKTKNRTISKHHTTYPSDNHAPAWKTFEFLTFGQVFKFYNKLKDSSLKTKISTVYGFRDYQLLDNFMLSIINVRNICSHNGVLYDFNQPTGIRRIPNKRYRNKIADTTCLNTSIRLILFVLSKISSARADELENEIKAIITSAKANPLLEEIINNKIKFDI